MSKKTIQNHTCFRLRFPNMFFLKTNVFVLGSIWGEIVLPFGPKMDMNRLAMARYGSRLSQDGATGHRNLLEAYLAILYIYISQFWTKKCKQKHQQ